MTSMQNRVARLPSPVLRRWRRLELRQQTMLAGATVAITAACLFAFLWLPAVRERDRLIARLPQLTAKIAVMQQQAEEIRELNAASPIAPAPPIAADAATLQAAFGDGTRVSVDDDRAFRIVIVKIGYAQWWDRLADVQARHQLQMASLAMRAVPGSNREVSVDMVLANRGSAKPSPVAVNVK